MKNILVMRGSLVMMEKYALSCFPINLNDFSKFLSSYFTSFYNSPKKKLIADYELVNI
jgi:hypothetical protein